MSGLSMLFSEIARQAPEPEKPAEKKQTGQTGFVTLCAHCGGYYLHQRNERGELECMVCKHVTPRRTIDQ